MIRMFLIAGAATLLLAGCEKEAPAPGRAAAGRSDYGGRSAIAETIPAVGVAKAYDEVNLVARVEGYLVNRNFKEGQEVKKDQLLYEIEPVLYRRRSRPPKPNWPRRRPIWPMPSSSTTASRHC